MPLPFEVRHATTAAAIDAAYETALTERRTSAARPLGTRSLLAQELAKATFGGHELSPEAERAFTAAFATTEAVFGHVDIIVPRPETFAHAGINFAHLGEAYQDMKAAGLEPDIVISPALSCYRTVALYKALTPTHGRGGVRDDKGIPNNPLAGASDDDSHHWHPGIIIATNVVAQWREHSQPPDGLPRVVDATDTPWTIRIIPGTDAPQDMGGASVNLDYCDALPTFSEYCTQQATRIQAGKPPIDNHQKSYTHLRISSDAAADGTWHSSGRVMLSVSSLQFQSSSLGSRRAIG